MGEDIKIARASLHMWEEPVISGKRGSGTVFFSGCALKCVYCQNYEISAGGFGKSVTPQRLREIYFELINQGAHNINLVNPSHYVRAIRDTLYDLPVPVVYNTGGYDKVDTIRSLRGLVDVYLTDLKYVSPELSKKYSKAEDYYTVAISAIREMVNQTGALQYDSDGMLTRGVIIRHLVLPRCFRDSLLVLDKIYEEFGTDKILLSLMSQYTPTENLKDYPELCRRVKECEYRRVVSHAQDLGFHGFMQDYSSADECYIPPFNLEGV